MLSQQLSAKKTPVAKQVSAKSSARKPSGKVSAASKPAKASSRKPSARKASAKKSNLIQVDEASPAAESEHKSSENLIVNPDFAMDLEAKDASSEPLAYVEAPEINLPKNSQVSVGFVAMDRV